VSHFRGALHYSDPISYDGRGWRADAPAAPLRPMTGEEYARMPPGTHDVHPADGTLRRKR